MQHELSLHSSKMQHELSLKALSMFGGGFGGGNPGLAPAPAPAPAPVPASDALVEWLTTAKIAHDESVLTQLRDLGCEAGTNILLLDELEMQNCGFKPFVLKKLLLLKNAPSD